MICSKWVDVQYVAAASLKPLRIARLYPSNMKGKLHGEHRAIAVAAITAIDLGLAEVPGGRLGLNGASTRHFSFLDKPLTRDSWLPFGVVRMAIPILLRRRLLLRLLRLPRLRPAGDSLCHDLAAVHGNVVVVV